MILRGYRLPLPNEIVFLSQKIVFDFANSADPDRVGVIKNVIVINCNLITFSKVIGCNCN